MVFDRVLLKLSGSCVVKIVFLSAEEIRRAPRLEREVKGRRGVQQKKIKYIYCMLYTVCLLWCKDDFDVCFSHWFAQ